MEIAVALKIWLSTVERVRTGYVKEGLKSVLRERARPGQRRKLNDKQKAHLVVIACSEPKVGHTRWTLAPNYNVSIHHIHIEMVLI